MNPPERYAPDDPREWMNRARSNPIIRDMRIAVEHVLGMLAAGDTVETILSDRPVD